MPIHTIPELTPLGCKSPPFKHVSFYRPVLMVLNKNKDKVNLVFEFRVEDFDYTVHITTMRLYCI